MRIFQDIGEAYTNIFMTLMLHMLDHGRCWVIQRNLQIGTPHTELHHTRQVTTVLWNAVATASGRYGKPDITNYIPVDASGNLLDPLAAGLVDNFDIPGRQSWVEVWRSSTGRDGMEKIQCLSVYSDEDTSTNKPAKFFSNLFDPSRLTTNVAGNQVYTDNRY